MTRPKLIDRSLASLARIRDHVPEFRLVIAGERRPHEYDVDADIAASGMNDFVICTDYLSESDFFLHIAAADIILNMRFPIGGESSGTLARGIGCGRACVVLDYGPMGEIPNGAVAKIPHGPSLDAALDQTLLKLMTQDATRQSIEREALRVSSHWTPQASAARYHAILESVDTRRSVVSPSVSVTARGRAAARAILHTGKTSEIRDFESLWWRYPVVFGEERSEDARILCIDEGVEGAHCLEQLFGWSAGSVEAVTLAQLLAKDADDVAVYDGALLMLDAAAFGKPQDVCRAIASRLRWGAAVVVELFNAQRGQAGEAAGVKDVLLALGCSGIHLFSENDLAPELESGLDRRAPIARFVGMGLRSSEMVTLAPRRGFADSFYRASPADGSWMLN